MSAPLQTTGTAKRPEKKTLMDIKQDFGVEQDKSQWISTLAKVVQTGDLKLQDSTLAGEVTAKCKKAIQLAKPNVTGIKVVEELLYDGVAHPMTLRKIFHDTGMNPDFSKESGILKDFRESKFGKNPSHLNTGLGGEGKKEAKSEGLMSRMFGAVKFGRAEGRSETGFEKRTETKLNKMDTRNLVMFTTVDYLQCDLFDTSMTRLNGVINPLFIGTCLVSLGIESFGPKKFFNASGMGASKPKVKDEGIVFLKSLNTLYTVVNEIYKEIFGLKMSKNSCVGFCPEVLMGRLGETDVANLTIFEPKSGKEKAIDAAILLRELQLNLTVTGRESKLKDELLARSLRIIDSSTGKFEGKLFRDSAALTSIFNFDGLADAGFKSTVDLIEFILDSEPEVRMGCVLTLTSYLQESLRAYSSSSLKAVDERMKRALKELEESQKRRLEGGSANDEDRSNLIDGELMFRGNEGQSSAGTFGKSVPGGLMATVKSGPEELLQGEGQASSRSPFDNIDLLAGGEQPSSSLFPIGEPASPAVVPEANTGGDTDAASPGVPTFNVASTDSDKSDEEKDDKDDQDDNKSED